MSDGTPKATVPVVIGGNTYNIRTGASEEYTRRCAAFVDSVVQDILRQGSVVEAHKAVILAALSITDQLFQAQAEQAKMRREYGRLAGMIDGALSTDDLANSP